MAVDGKDSCSWWKRCRDTFVLRDIHDSISMNRVFLCLLNHPEHGNHLLQPAVTHALIANIVLGSFAQIGHELTNGSDEGKCN